MRSGRQLPHSPAGNGLAAQLLHPILLHSAHIASLRASSHGKLTLGFLIARHETITRVKEKEEIDKVSSKKPLFFFPPRSSPGLKYNEIPKGPPQGRAKAQSQTLSDPLQLQRKQLEARPKRGDQRFRPGRAAPPPNRIPGRMMSSRTKGLVSIFAISLVARHVAAFKVFYPLLPRRRRLHPLSHPFSSRPLGTQPLSLAFSCLAHPPPLATHAYRKW